MSHLKRPHVSDDGVWHFFNSDLQTWKVKDDGKAFTSGQRFKAGSPHTGQGRKSTATPPYHIHLYQTETFHVKEGTMCYLIDGKEGKLETGQKADIPPYRPHTFWNDPSTGTDLVAEITVQGGDRAGFDESFVHNFYGYLSSVTMAGRMPNPLQMLRFLDDADVILVDVPFGLGHWANIIIGESMPDFICTFKNLFADREVPAGRWLGGLLGYPTRYKIFDD